MSLPTVRVHQRGIVEADSVRDDPSVQAVCEQCGRAGESVALLGRKGAQAALCAECLRAGLEAMSVARYRLREDKKLPWGKVTG